MKVRANQLTEAFRGVKTEKTLMKGAESLGFERQRSWEVELAGTDDVRADVVARGKALIASPNYPSRQQLQRVAQVLAGRLG